MYTTQRLILRHWKETDLQPFAALNADPHVMQHFPKILTSDESDRLAGRIQKGITEKGYGLWAIETQQESAFIGFVGLSDVHFDADFTPAIEVGWRLDVGYWGRGYATEAAQKALQIGFEQIRLKNICSFTFRGNHASRRVMEKLGMRYIQDFSHPSLDKEDPLQPHVLYNITSSDFSSMKSTPSEQIQT